MNKTDDISRQLQSLLTDYHFNIDTLAKYFGLTAAEVEKLAAGDISFLPDDNAYRFNLFNKILFLYDSATNEKDLKLDAFLKVLLSYHHLSKETIASVSGVPLAEIEAFLSMQGAEISAESKYKLAVTVMSLRFFLKDIEPQN